MKGKHQDIQKCLLEINLKALYMPYACPRPNLTFMTWQNLAHKLFHSSVLYKEYMHCFNVLLKSGIFCAKMLQTYYETFI
jgi:hypothetical protein